MPGWSPSTSSSPRRTPTGRPCATRRCGPSAPGSTRSGSSTTSRASPAGTAISSASPGWGTRRGHVDGRAGGDGGEHLEPPDRHTCRRGHVRERHQRAPLPPRCRRRYRTRQPMGDRTARLPEPSWRIASTSATPESSNCSTSPTRCGNPIAANNSPRSTCRRNRLRIVGVNSVALSTIAGRRAEGSTSPGTTRDVTSSSPQPRVRLAVVRSSHGVDHLVTRTPRSGASHPARHGRRRARPDHPGRDRRRQDLRRPALNVTARGGRAWGARTAAPNRRPTMRVHRPTHDAR